MELQVIKGDITKIQVDAIVNAANSSLMGGGGVDGAIHRAGGPEILDECIIIKNTQGKCPPGEAVITTAGRLPAKYVIHTVGPIWQGGSYGEQIKLKNCYLNSLNIAVENNIKTIAFPNISTGVYGYPKKEAAITAIETIKNASYPTIDKVIFVCFDDENFNLYNEHIR